MNLTAYIQMLTCGGPGSGRYPKGSGMAPDASMTFYHGTAPENVESIRRDGVKRPAHDSDVFMTLDPESAKGWAMSKYPNAKQIALVRIKFDQDAIRNVKGGSRGSWDDEYSHNGTIDPKHIKGIRLVKAK